MSDPQGLTPPLNADAAWPSRTRPALGARLLLVLGLPLLVGHAVDDLAGAVLGERRRPCSAAASWYQLERQLRQKPARFMRSMFCTSVRVAEMLHQPPERGRLELRRPASCRAWSSCPSPCLCRAGRLRGPPASGLRISRRPRRRPGRFAQNPLHDAAEAPAPGRLSGRIADQVLPDLDDGVGKPALGRRAATGSRRRAARHRARSRRR